MAPSRATKAASKPVRVVVPEKPARTRAAKPAPSPPPAAASDSPADLVDSQLAKYRSMRDFHATAEPSGEGKVAKQKAAARTSPARAKSSGGLPFVIQKHAASHLHYDFRLGWSGVLKSWAVAKGPSYFPGDRRLAIQVEDHPMEYGGFEGIIPQGQYGGGTVMVWDQGTWWPQPGHENVEAGLRTGSLKFEMHGTKMQGKWTLVRMNAHSRTGYGADSRWKSSDKPQWLLIKEHDQFERPANAPAITEQEPNSALTGRTMEEIAHQEDHVWNSKNSDSNPAGTGQAWYRQEPNGNSAPSASSRPAARPERRSPRVSPDESSSESGPAPSLTIAPRTPAKPVAAKPAPPPLLDLADALDELPPEPQPEFIQPQLAQETETPPEGNAWLHELKLDGYRMQARKSTRGANVTVQMLTRSGLDWTYRVPHVADAVAKLPVQNVTLDGEVVVLAENGTTNFADLQASFQEGAKYALTFFCFDLLHLEGHNPRNAPLRERKALLEKILSREEQAGIVRFSEHIEGNGRQIFEQACELHAEGIISKRADATYRAGRSADWLKSKCLHEQEFVIGGFSLSSDGPDRIGSLILGYYNPAEPGKKDAKKLIYAGRTGTGFTQKMRRDLRARLASLETKKPAFAEVPADARRGALWVKPELVAQVRFATWTAEDYVRQAAFLGLREDKRPAEVFREAPTKAPQPKHNGSRPKSDSDPSPTASPRPEAPQTLSSRPVTTQTPSSRPVAPKKLSSRPERSGVERPASAPAQTPASPAIRLTHPAKILDPASGLTKQQLADYYWAVAERMLPHIAGRPLSLVRCPDGAGKPCFYQKHVNHMLPPGVRSVMVSDKKSGKPEPYITLSTAEALAGLAQMAVLEVHPWGSHNDDLEHPDRLIFDLDPDESIPWNTVGEAALEVRARLKKIGLESFLKTTGGKGLHIVAPIQPELTFAELKEAAHNFVLAMERNNPALYLTKMTKSARKGKIYLDYLRNERGATAVAPFSPRARPGVHVSATLDWKELGTGERPVFTVTDFPSWQDRLRRDPWRRLLTLQQRLEPARIRNL